jgi:hypothetical protein
VYYNKHRDALFVSRHNNTSLASFDEGAAWQNFGSPVCAGWHDGFVFIDSLHGIIAPYTWDVGPTFYNYYRTSDGGLTWEKLPFQEQTWQPAAHKGSYYIVTDYHPPLNGAVVNPNNTVYKSNDLGSNWSMIYKFSGSMTGTLLSDSSAIYGQSGHFANGDPKNPVNPLGILRSTDEGNSWQSICGPDNVGETRFYVSDYGIWAGDSLGGLWFNRTKKGAVPRLQIEKDNVTRHCIGSTAGFPVSIFYPHEAYYEAVDSLSFILNYTNAAEYLRDSIVAGWTVLRREINNNSIRFILQHTGASPAQTDSLLLKVYFRGVITDEQTATLTLDEINFNQDTTFRDCMIAALSKTDTFYVDIQGSCGDSILREFMKTGKVMNITSLHPNPSQNEVTVDLHSAIMQNANIEIIDALGVKVLSVAKNLLSGSNSIHLNTRNLSAGVYLIRIISPNGAASQSFVKIR